MRPNISGTMKADAFTRVELLVMLASVGLLSIVGLSASADTRERSERIVCINNLRQVGRAFHARAAEVGGENPWRAPVEQGGTSQPLDGTATYHVPGIGTFPGGIRNNAWFHYVWVYEDLPSPLVLVCPSDANRRRAFHFSTTAGGFAHLSMQNNAVSYTLGTDALREYSNAIVSADRNIVSDQRSTLCSGGYSTVRSIWIRGGVTTGWTNGLHSASGQTLMNDGRVEVTTSAELMALAYRSDDSGAFHILYP